MEKREVESVLNKGVSFDFIKENCKTIGDLRRLVEIYFARGIYSDW